MAKGRRPKMQADNLREFSPRPCKCCGGRGTLITLPDTNVTYGEAWDLIQAIITAPDMVKYYEALHKAEEAVVDDYWIQVIALEQLNKMHKRGDLRL